MRPMHHRVRRVLAALAIPLPLFAAGGCRTSDPEASVPPREREMVPARWTTLWRAGGAEQDTVLLFPTGLIAADSEHVYVPDAGAFRVAAFRVRDGSLAWTFGRRGEGPGEFSSFIAIAVNQRGQIVVADNQSARLTVLDRQGRLVDEISGNQLPGIESFCPLPGGDYLVSTGRSSDPEPIVRLSSTGEVTARYAMPWTDLRDAAAIKRQLFVTHAGADACVLALKLGRGFSLYRNGRFTTRPYVEDLPLPEVEVTTRELENGGRSRAERLLVHQVGPTGIHGTGDTLVVPFVGRTEHAARVVDLYDLARGGRYLSSYLLPRRVDAVHRRGALHFVLRPSEGHPALYALRIDPDTTTSPHEGIAIRVTPRGARRCGIHNRYPTACCCFSM